MGKESGIKSFDTLSEERWTRIEKKKFFFGHRSVGLNIIDGLKDIIAERRSSLRIIESTDPHDYESPVFGHVPVGKNLDPIAKINHFREILESGIGNLVDTAFLKLCYVDIDNRTDIERLFRFYKQAIHRLAEKYPRVRILHFTVPLEMKESTLKAVLKKALGKDIAGEGTNIGKKRYNELIKNEYDECDVFDIASIESTYPNGKSNVSTYRNNVYYSLVPEYTDDGGHLNAKGRRIVAEQLCFFLAE
jgi:hypothetical protein